jgi:O-acetyl-ADP-ribose deacetylase (regulator of RNase III)
VIRAVVDDLAFIEADAVLRPSDASLEPVTAAAVRLDRHAGPRFAEQRRLATPLEAGAAVITGGGDLAAAYVIHVIIQDPQTLTTRDTVRRALIAAWQQAAGWGLATLAAPPLGAGAGLLDLEEATELMSETFPQNGVLRELTIVVEREGDLAVVEAAIRRAGR